MDSWKWVLQVEKKRTQKGRSWRMKRWNLIIDTRYYLTRIEIGEDKDDTWEWTHETKFEVTGKRSRDTTMEAEGIGDPI